MINIALVDDHEIVRDGIKAMMIGNEEIKLTESFATANDFFLKLKSDDSFFDVLILDIALPNISGIECARQLCRENRNIKILMLSANVGKHYIENALKAGAKGFLPKDCSKKELFNAIHEVYYGNIYIGKNVEQVVWKNYINVLERNGNEGLSDREVEIIAGFANGMSYNELSDKLSISKKTIESHKKNIYDKLQLKNNAELIKYAIKYNIVEI